MRTLKQALNRLPPAKRAKVIARSRALITEEILRKARKLTQEQRKRPKRAKPRR